jgi:hypothetical protein
MASVNRLWCFVAVLLLATGAAHAAAPDATVETLKMPAWHVRGAVSSPLAPGMALRNGDQIRTGAGARVLLRLADGSTVKLGEHARFSLTGMGMHPAVYRATLGVIEGAFRFTTTLLYRYRGAREVQVRFSTVTAGIRGTDLWGKSTGEGDIVALIEGRIELTRAGEPAVQMERAGTWYQAPRNAPSIAVQPIPAELLARFAQETEIGPGEGAAGRGGRWRVTLASGGAFADTIGAHDRLREAGYAAAVQQHAGSDRRYQVVIDGLIGEADATALATRLRAEFGFADARALRR